MKEMTVLQYIKTTLEMRPTEFMAQWRDLSDADKEWYKQAARLEMEIEGVKIKS